MFIKLSIYLFVYPIPSYPIPSIDDIVIGRCWVDLCGFIGSWLVLNGSSGATSCCLNRIWLVVWNVLFIFQYIYIHIYIWDNPSHWLSYFQEGWNHQPGIIDLPCVYDVEIRTVSRIALGSSLLPWGEGLINCDEPNLQCEAPKR